MRCRSSAGASFSQSGRGTTPNIAPPSSRNGPSCSIVSCRSPKASRLISSTGPWRRRLLQLDEHAVRRRRMDERDQRVLRPGPRLGVDQADAARLELLERGANVLDPQRDVVEARTALLDVFRDRRVRRRRLEQFERRAADGNVARADALRDNLLRRPDLETERVAVERQRLLDVLHRDADVIEHGFHSVQRLAHETARPRSRDRSAVPRCLDQPLELA